MDEIRQYFAHHLQVYIYHIHDILTICSDTCMYALCRFTQSQTLLDNKQTLISPRKSGASETPKRAGNYLPREHAICNFLRTCIFHLAYIFKKI